MVEIAKAETMDVGAFFPHTLEHLFRLVGGFCHIFIFKPENLKLDSYAEKEAL